MKIKTEVWYLPRPATNYPGSVPLYFEERIPKVLETKNFIHLFSGSCRFGHTIDIRKEIKVYSYKEKKEIIVRPNTICNVEKLPFEDNSFEGGFADPPYNKKYAKKLYECELPDYKKWSKELVRVVKPGGLIGILHFFNLGRLYNCKTEKKIIILLRAPSHTARILNIYRKNGSKPTKIDDFIN